MIDIIDPLSKLLIGILRSLNFACLAIRDFFKFLSIQSKHLKYNDFGNCFPQGILKDKTSRPAILLKKL